MKVYDWKTLISTVLSSGLLIVSFVIRFNGIFDFLIIAFLCYLIIHGLRISLTKSGYEAEQRRIKNSRELRQKMLDKYGKSAYVLMYSPFAILIIGIYISLALAYASTYKNLAAIIFIATMVIYIILITIIKVLEKKLKTE